MRCDEMSLIIHPAWETALSANSYQQELRRELANFAGGLGSGLGSAVFDSRTYR